jgi:hypothetical protein
MIFLYWGQISPSIILDQILICPKYKKCERLIKTLFLSKIEWINRKKFKETKCIFNLF